nr:hypothetical protein CFP56_19196 [Quercus suber]
MTDHLRSTGWALLTPAPVISLIWSAIDIALFLLKHYYDVYWLVTTIILAALYSSLGTVGIGLYVWSNRGAWVGGMFLVFMAVFMKRDVFAEYRSRTCACALPQKQFVNSNLADGHPAARPCSFQLLKTSTVLVSACVAELRHNSSTVEVRASSHSRGLARHSIPLEDSVSICSDHKPLNVG